jgi:5-methylcytosine-specific restriction endonuclease McrA
MGAALGPCPLCGRPLVDGPSVDRHHLVPKAEGGRQAVVMHRICHRKIHSVLDERDLATAYHEPEALKAHPEIARFVRWVRTKPPELYKRTEPARRRRRR